MDAVDGVTGDPVRDANGNVGAKAKAKERKGGNAKRRNRRGRGNERDGCAYHHDR